MDKLLNDIDRLMAELAAKIAHLRVCHTVNGGAPRTNFVLMGTETGRVSYPRRTDDELAQIAADRAVSTERVMDDIEMGLR